MADTPLLPEEGWTRHQEDIAKPPLRSGRGGRSHAIFPNASLNTACARRCFLMAAGIASCFALSRSRFARACAGSARRLRRFGGFAPFSYWRSHPSSRRPLGGGECLARTNLVAATPRCVFVVTDKCSAEVVCVPEDSRNSKRPHYRDCRLPALPSLGRVPRRSRPQ